MRPVPSPPADAEVRQRVIHLRDRPLVVEAGAGTGKTSLLVARLLAALEADAVRMHEVVAISFTEKAAAELRWRLRGALEARGAADAVADAGRACVQRALHELHEARISTIHAFAASILRERPVEAQLDPQFRTLDELESLQLLRSFWRRWVDEELEGSDAERLLLPALQAGVRLTPDLEALARALYDNRDLHDFVRCPAVPADLEERMRALRDELLRCVRHAEDNCRDAGDKGMQHLRQVQKAVEPLEDMRMSSWPAVFLGSLSIRPHAGRRESWRNESCAESKAWRARLQVSLQEVQQHLAHRVLRGSLQWLGRWLQAYEAEKRRLGVLDFQDLLLQAQRLVRDDLAVRVALGRRIGMLCIDEFQDTDPLQAQLALFLAEVGRPSPDWKDVTVGPRLFLVGDPRQSIYRFRRADLDVYQRCCDIVRRSGGEVLDIVQNFRSRPAILAWTNGVFAHRFAGADTASGDVATEDEADRASGAAEPRHVPLVPLPETDNPRPAVWIVREAPGGTASDSEATRQQEARALVGMIQRALREAWPVRQGRERRPLRASDMALLFGRTSGIEHYEDALRQAGIPFRQEGGRLFFQRQEVRDLLHALAASDDPHDEWSIVAALRSPLFGATDEDLWRHRDRFHSFRYTEGSTEGSPLHEALQILQAVHHERHQRGIAGCVEMLLERTSARAVYAVQPQGSRALNNLDMLCRQARLFAAAGDRGLREFVRSLRELEDDTPRLAEWAPEEDAGDHVRLITVHMAKGLEFPFVVLANLNTHGNPGREPLVFDRMRERAEVRLGAADLGTSLKTAGFGEASQRERHKDVAEDDRLLYVAATRARDYLVVGDFPGARATGYLKTLQSVPGALGTQALGDLPAPDLVGEDSVEAAPWCVVEASTLQRERRLTPARRASTRDKPLSAWLLERTRWAQAHHDTLQRGLREGGRLSPTTLLHRAGAADQEVVAADESLLGRVTHAALEEWRPDLSQEALADMAAEMCDRFHAGDLVEAVHAFLRTAAADHRVRDWMQRGGTVTRSVPMMARLGSRLVEAVQDVLIETGEGVLGIDFTARARSGSDAATEARVQALHAALLAQSGRKLAGVGTFYLGDGVWQELDDAAQAARDFMHALQEVSEDGSAG